MALLTKKQTDQPIDSLANLPDVIECRQAVALAQDLDRLHASTSDRSLEFLNQRDRSHSACTAAANSLSRTIILAAQARMPSLEARLARIAGRFVDAEDIAAVVRIGCQHSFLANRWREAIARISPFVGLPAALLALEMAPTYLLPEAEVQTEELPSPEKKPSQHEYAIRLREIRARISALKERLILAVGPERAEVKGEISDQIEVGMGFAERLFRVVHAQAEKTWTDDPALIEGGFEPFIMPDRMPLVVEFVSGRSKAFKFVRATRNAGGVPVGEASLDYAISLADAVL